MRTALVLGGAKCVWKDADAAMRSIAFDGTFAVNEIGVHWPGEIDGWVTLHPHQFNTGPKWTEQREKNGFQPARQYFAHPAAFKNYEGFGLDGFVTKADYSFAGEKSGSSGLFAAKVALVDAGYDCIVFCGIPMTPMNHFTGRDTWTGDKSSAIGFRQSWLDVPKEYRNRMKSMSGWTAILLGKPKEIADAGL